MFIFNDANSNRNWSIKEKQWLWEFDWLWNELVDQGVEFKVFNAYQQWCWCGGKTKQTKCVFEADDMDKLQLIVWDKNTAYWLQEFGDWFFRYPEKKWMQYQINDKFWYHNKNRPWAVLITRLI